MRKIKGLSISLLCLSLLFISGCWDQQELQNLSVIKVWGIDKEDGETKPWLVSSLVMDPTSRGKSSEGSTGGGGVSPEIPWLGRGATIQEAESEIIKRTPRFTFLSHTDVVVIGEKAAREGVKDIMEVIARSPQARPRLKIMVTPGMAKDITQTEPEASRTISQELRGLADRAVERMGLSMDVDFIKFDQWLCADFRDPVAPKVMVVYPEELRGEKRAGPYSSVLIEGLAVFRGDKMVGWLDKEEALGYLLLTNTLDRAEIPIAFSFEGKELSFYLRSSKTKLQTKLEDKRLKADFRVKADGSIIEASGVVLSDENREPLQQAIDQRLVAIIEATVQKLQEYQSDCLGVTENLYHFHQSQYQQIKGDWHEVFAEGDIQFTVESTIRNSGKVGESF